MIEQVEQRRQLPLSYIYVGCAVQKSSEQQEQQIEQYKTPPPPIQGVVSVDTCVHCVCMVGGEGEGG